MGDIRDLSPVESGGDCLIENIRERLRFAKKLRDRIRREGHHIPSDIIADCRVHPDLTSFELNLMQLSACMFTDFRFTQTPFCNSHWISDMLEGILSIESFLAIYLQSQLVDRGAAAPGDDQDAPASGAEKSKAFERDDLRCVFSSETNVGKYYLWPLASTNNVENWRETRDILNDHLIALGPGLRDQLRELVVPIGGPLGYELSVSDKTWNILPVVPRIREWLGTGRAGLKWLGPTGETTVTTGKEDNTACTEYAHYRVQWFWLPPSVHDEIQDHILHGKEVLAPRSLVRLSSEDDIELLASRLEKLFSARPETFSATAVTARDRAGSLIPNGRIFTLQVNKQDLEKTEVMFKAAWVVACMASFSGASEIYDQLDRNRPPWSLRLLFMRWMPTLQPRS